MITATVTNFGDSLGIQFPKSLLKNAPISENDDVEILIRNNRLIVKSLKDARHLTTKERIVAFCEATENVQLSEVDWGKPQGKEIW